MRFFTWLADQIDTEGPAADFARVWQADVNNGCALATWKPDTWLTHFTSRHPDRAEALTDMLVKAYAVYLEENPRVKA